MRDVTGLDHLVEVGLVVHCKDLDLQLGTLLAVTGDRNNVSLLIPSLYCVRPRLVAVFIVARVFARVALQLRLLEREISENAYVSKLRCERTTVTHCNVIQSLTGLILEF